jgi:pimeloyl-ACP methyl ester carboxylesterase
MILNDFRIVDRHGGRVAAWMNPEGVLIIATRGTTPFSADGFADLGDDIKISGSDFCNLSLVKTADEVVAKHADKAKSIIFVGHSLGGTSAMCLTGKYSSFAIPVRGIGFNSGAAPTNPILSGPGPQRFRHYHIVGDLISSHMGPQAAEVIRIKKSKAAFGGTWAHSTPRLLTADGDWAFATADEEDQMFNQWATTYRVGWEVLIPTGPIAKFIRVITSGKISEKNPIPGSTRFNNKTA